MWYFNLEISTQRDTMLKLNNYCNRLACKLVSLDIVSMIRDLTFARSSVEDVYSDRSLNLVFIS